MFWSRKQQMKPLYERDHEFYYNFYVYHCVHWLLFKQITTCDLEFLLIFLLSISEIKCNFGIFFVDILFSFGCMKQLVLSIGRRLPMEEIPFGNFVNIFNWNLCHIKCKLYYSFIACQTLFYCSTSDFSMSYCIVVAIFEIIFMEELIWLSFFFQLDTILWFIGIKTGTVYRK